MDSPFFFALQIQCIHMWESWLLVAIAFVCIRNTASLLLCMYMHKCMFFERPWDIKSNSSLFSSMHWASYLFHFKRFSLSFHVYMYVCNWCMHILSRSLFSSNNNCKVKIECIQHFSCSMPFPYFLSLFLRVCMHVSEIWNSLKDDDEMYSLFLTFSLSLLVSTVYKQIAIHTICFHVYVYMRVIDKFFWSLHSSSSSSSYFFSSSCSCHVLKQFTL